MSYFWLRQTLPGVRKSDFRLVIWDIQTGVIVQEFGTQNPNSIIFHGDQRKITSITRDLQFYTYDALNSTQLCQGQISSFQGSELGAHEAHNNTLQFTTSFESNGKLVINIHELQPTSTSPLHLLSSFSIPPQSGKFSFSPVSFHASFVTRREVFILNIQCLRPLLEAKVGQETYTPGQFSPDGCFFACEIMGDEIYVWQNTPSGYVPWSHLKPRLSYVGFSWAPTSISILCWGEGGIQLLHPSNYPSPMSPDKVMPHLPGNYLVAYSADQKYVATAQKGSSVVTVLDHHRGTTQLSISTDMQIQDIKIVQNAIFVVDIHKLATWDLKTGSVVHNTHGAGGMTFDEPLDMNSDGAHLVLSHNCSQIVFTTEQKIFLYDVKASKHTSVAIKDGGLILDIQLSPNSHGMWLLKRNAYYQPIRSGPWPQISYDLVELELEGGDSSNVTIKSVGGEWPWVNLFSPHKYHVGKGSGWVTDSRGGELLWLPPNWRINSWQDARWDGCFLALVDGCHPEPMIIKCQL